MVTNGSSLIADNADFDFNAYSLIYTFLLYRQIKFQKFVL